MKHEENTLVELNAMLFDELKRLNNPNLTKDELEKEIHRATAINKTALVIHNGAGLMLRAKIAQDDSLRANSKLPIMFNYDDTKEK